VEPFAPWPLDVEAVCAAHTFRDGKLESFSIATERIAGTSITFAWLFARPQG
jgi:hypothetical protein